MTEDQGLKNLTEATIKAEAAEQLQVEARQRLAQFQSATGRRWSLVLVALSALLVLQAKAQTTGVYSITAGTACLQRGIGSNTVSIQSCLLPATQTEPNGYIATGYFDVWQFVYQTPVFKAQYCATYGTNPAWTVNTIDPTHNEYLLDCDATAEQTSQDDPMHIHVDVFAHSVTTFGCHYRWCGYSTTWYVDKGSVTLTPLAPGL